MYYEYLKQDRYYKLVEALHSPNPPPGDEFYPNLWAQAAGGGRQSGRVRGISKGIIINEVIDQPTSRHLVDSRASLRPIEVDRSLEATIEALKKDNEEMKKDREEMKKSREKMESKFSKMSKLMLRLLKGKKKVDTSSSRANNEDGDSDDFDEDELMRSISDE